MRSLVLLAVASAATAAIFDVTTERFFPSGCRDNSDCRRFGDARALCDLATPKCICSPGFDSLAVTTGPMSRQCVGRVGKASTPSLVTVSFYVVHERADCILYGATQRKLMKEVVTTALGPVRTINSTCSSFRDDITSVIFYGTVDVPFSELAYIYGTYRFDDAIVAVTTSAEGLEKYRKLRLDNKIEFHALLSATKQCRSEGAVAALNIPSDSTNCQALECEPGYMRHNINGISFCAEKRAPVKREGEDGAGPWGYDDDLTTGEKTAIICAILLSFVALIALLLVITCCMTGGSQAGKTEGPADEF